MVKGTFKLGDLQLFGLMQFVVTVSVFVQQPTVVLALDLMLLLQIIILLLQVLVLALTRKKEHCHYVLLITINTYLHVNKVEKH